MKASFYPSLLAAAIIAASSIGYSAYTAAQVRDLGRRLHHTETLEERIANVEQQIRPHLKVLPPYVPDR
jgi:hypothetical protein